MCYSILFLDDETFFASAYVDRLKEVFDVHYRDNVKDALDALHSARTYHGLVLDVMMPMTADMPANILDIDTGLWVLAEAKSLVMDRPMPVLILTNRDVEHVRKHVMCLGFPDGVVDVYRKIDMPAKRLPHALETLLHRWHQTKKAKKSANNNAEPIQ